MASYLVILPLVLTSVLGASPWYANVRSDEYANDPKIIGGSDAPDGKYPYQISIRADGSHTCGGSIIDREWILTAAHCMARYPAEKYLIYVGSNELDGGGTFYRVLEKHLHEDFNLELIINDVAVVKVEPITFNNKVQPILLDTEDIGGDELCVASGWGSQDLGGPSPNKLQHIQLNTTTLEYCKSRFLPPLPQVHESEICTLTKKGEGLCHGDSGGPLVREVDGTIKQIGIFSWIFPCAEGYPDVYGRTSWFAPWIKEKCNCI